MDNKQNRQFYWEVKQFINGNNTPKAPEVKKPSVKDAISGVLGENSVYKQTSFVPNTGTNDVVRSYLHTLGDSEKKNTPSSILFTKNSVANPFNLLNEANARPMQNPTPSQDGTGRWTGGYEGSPLQRARAKKYAEEAESTRKFKAREKELADLRVAAREQDEFDDLQKEFKDAGIEMPSGVEYEAGDVPEYGKNSRTARAMAMLRKGDRGKLEQYRSKKDAERLDALRYGSPDPSKMSPEEKSKYMAGSGDSTGVPAKVKRDIKSLSRNELDELEQLERKERRKKAEEETGGFVISGKSESEMEKDRRLQPVLDYMRKGREKIVADERAKAGRTAINPSYGSVTPDSFKTSYGVDYDPRNPKHGTMIQALHGQNTGRSVEGAGTVEGWKTVMDVQADDARAAQREKRDAEAMKQADERVSASAKELTRWRKLSQADKMKEANAEFAQTPQGQKVLRDASMQMQQQDIEQERGSYFTSPGEGGLNVPTEANRGMNQRSVASRASSMFGSGRGALGSANRMNA